MLLHRSSLSYSYSTLVSMTISIKIAAKNSKH